MSKKVLFGFDYTNNEFVKIILFIIKKLAIYSEQITFYFQI